MGKILKRSDFSLLSLDNVFLLIFALVCLALVAFFYPQSAYSFDRNSFVSEIIICISLVFCGAVAIFKNANGGLDYKTIMGLMFICGFALRLAYVIKYPYSANQHDVETLKTSGHLSYIYNASKGEFLQKTNNWQFCHPPLHHILSGVMVNLSRFLGGGNNNAFENVQLLTCAYSTLFMSVGYKLLRVSRVSGKVLVYCFMLLAFHPFFSILAGSINCDTLSILLMMYAIFYMVKWYLEPKVKYAFLTGLFAGLGMMAKFSVAVVCVVTAIVAIIKLIADKKLKFNRFAGHTCIYLLSSLPLGLWYQIRNAILFNQPLGYVAQIDKSSKLFIGDMSIAERFLMPFSFQEVGVYVDVWNEHNLWQYLLRNSLFGEYSFGKDGVATFAVIANLILIIGVILSLAYLLIFKLSEMRATLPVTILLVVQLGFFIYFNIKNPYRCSMDFRYIVPLLFGGITVLGMAGSVINKNNILSKITVPILKFSAIVLSVCSVIIFL